MSLVGNLEDLGFGDILQIISLSRKSGVFLVHEETRRAKILFRSGQIIAAFTNFERQDLCERLLSTGAADESIVSGAVESFRRHGGRMAIADCLVEAGADPKAVDQEVRAQIEQAVIAIFGWEDGEFSFELKEIDEDLQRVRANPYRLLLEAGINPQFLAMEGTRLRDESRRGKKKAPPAEVPQTQPPLESRQAPDAGTPAGSPAETPSAQPVGQAAAGEAPAPASGSAGAEAQVHAPPEVVPASDQPAIVLVDDDLRFLEMVSSALAEKGQRVECFEDGGAAYDWLEKGADSQQPLCIVSDLIMPRTDGEGILGGLELLERVRASRRSLPFVLFSDHPHDEADQKARLLDVDFVLAKPRSAELSPGGRSPSFENFLSALEPILCSFQRQREEATRPADAEDPEATDPAAGTVGPETAEQTEQGDGSVVDLRRALLTDFEDADEDFRSPAPAAADTTPGLTMLRSMLCELSSPIAGGQISLLVLRFAAEVMNRAAIFMAGRDEVVGLGQFGITTAGGKPDRQVRSIRIPLSEPSVFHDVVAKRSVLRGPLEENRWNAKLIEALGGTKPADAFVAPIVAGDKVVAVLYGDNLPDQEKVQDTEALEIFLTQAGVAFEKAILERRIRELDVRP